jgi:phospholipid/cholesterol/gamma-HCH transport system substrate-binding protein
LGLVFIAALVLMLVGVIAGYKQIFVPYIPIDVQVPRSGLLMDAGADVTFHGVIVGKVREVRVDGNSAVLNVGISPDKAKYISSGTVASIVAPTLFGAKYVSLTTPASALPTRTITAGDVIRSSLVSTETNDLLANFNTFLRSVNVAQLDTALGGISTTLSGRGVQLGQMITDLDSYVADMQPSIPPLTSDLRKTADVARVYAAATPDLVSTLENLGTTSRTLADERQNLPRLLSGLSGSAKITRGLLDKNGDSIEHMLSVLRPTTSLLGYYSPMFPCLFASINQQRMHLDKVMGYQYAGLHMYDQFVPGVAPYKYPRDLTRIVPVTRPSCYGGPIKPADAPAPYVRFADGSNNFDPTDSTTLAPGSPLTNPLPQFGPWQGRGQRPPGGSDSTYGSPALRHDAIPGNVAEIRGDRGGK